MWVEMGRVNLALLLALVVQTAAAQTAPVADARIPALFGTTFAGAPISFPDALRGRVSVLVIGFSRESQASAEDWGKRLAATYQKPSGVMYYELPVVADVPSLLRNWVIGRIRHSVSEAARTHFVPVIDGEAAWKLAAGANSGAYACVLVVDKQAAVRWRYQGAVSESAFAELERQARAAERQ